MKCWAVYRDPARGAAGCLVLLWEIRDGKPVCLGDPVPAADLEAARALLPDRATLLRRPAKASRKEALNLIETWEAKAT